MLSLSDPNTVVSDEGFSVRVLGRTGIRYREGDRELHIDSEALAGPAGMAIYAHSIRSWEPPCQDVPLDEVSRARVIENVRAAFKFWGFSIDVL